MEIIKASNGTMSKHIEAILKREEAKKAAGVPDMNDGWRERMEAKLEGGNNTHGIYL